jgi:hypothetical protein
MREVVIQEESLSKVMGTCLLEEEKGRFREAMRTGRIRFFLAGKIPHDGVRDFATQPFGRKAKPFGIGNSSNDFHPAIFAPHSALTSR